MNDGRLEETLKSIGNLAYEVTFDRDGHMVAWNVHRDACGSEAGYRLSIGNGLARQTDVDSNVDLRHRHLNVALSLNKGPFVLKMVRLEAST